MHPCEPGNEICCRDAGTSVKEALSVTGRTRMPDTGHRALEYVNVGFCLAFIWSLLVVVVVLLLLVLLLLLLVSVFSSSYSHSS